MFAANSARESNSDAVDRRNRLRPTKAKLATCGKIAQYMGTLSKELNSCIVMDLGGC